MQELHLPCQSFVLCCRENSCEEKRKKVCHKEIDKERFVEICDEGAIKMEDRDWYIIQALYVQKNITKAAQSLYMSQPALTSRLQHIERDFNVRIVHRSTKGIQFTPEGEYLVKQAVDMIDRLSHIKNNVQGLFSENAGTLEIGASSYLTMYTLPKLLEEFQQMYPAVKFRVLADWSKNVFSLIYNQKIQVGFVSIDYGGCKNMELLYEEPICVAYRKPFVLEDLPNLPRIVYQSDYLLKSQLDKWWREHFTIPPEISMQVSKLTNCKEMVMHGLGYALLPSRIVDEAEGLYKMELISANGKLLTRKTWMLYNETGTDLPIVKLFVDFVKAHEF